MHFLRIKPLSVNKAWKGKRYKTDLYKRFEKQLPYLIKKQPIPEGKLEVHYIFGLSSKLADWDNPIKQFQDILSKTLGFDDRRIYRGIVDKVDVDKGKEFIKYEIYKLGDKKVKIN